MPSSDGGDDDDRHDDRSVGPRAGDGFASSHYGLRGILPERRAREMALEPRTTPDEVRESTGPRGANQQLAPLAPLAPLPSLDPSGSVRLVDWAAPRAALVWESHVERAQRRPLARRDDRARVRQLAERPSPSPRPPSIGPRRSRRPTPNRRSQSATPSHRARHPRPSMETLPPAGGRSKGKLGPGAPVIVGDS